MGDLFLITSENVGRPLMSMPTPMMNSKVGAGRVCEDNRCRIVLGGFGRKEGAKTAKPEELEDYTTLTISELSHNRPLTQRYNKQSLEEVWLSPTLSISEHPSSPFRPGFAREVYRTA